MNCKNCGIENEEKAKFCRSCGREIKKNVDYSNIIKEEKISQTSEYSLEEKFKKNRHSILGIVIIVIILIIGFTFYWVQIRPSNIKKKCSWTIEKIPADIGVTKEQAEINKKAFLQECAAKNDVSFKCYQMMNEGIERPSQPEREEVTEATEKEYEMCLRQNGL